MVTDLDSFDFKLKNMNFMCSFFIRKALNLSMKLKEVQRKELGF